MKLKISNKLYNINLNNNLLAINNPVQILKLNVYNAVLWGANGYHGLIPHNRKYYWNSINNYFEPIYYDGNFAINDGYSNPDDFSPTDSDWDIDKFSRQK